MRSPTAIRRQLEHFRNGCETDAATRNAWIAALEWVLAGSSPDPKFDDLSPFGQLVRAAIAARSALRSYQYGNAAPDLAEEVAEALENTIPLALAERGDDIAQMTKMLTELQEATNRLVSEMKPHDR